MSSRTPRRRACCACSPSATRTPWRRRSGARPGVKQTPSQRTPAPSSSASSAGAVALVLDQQVRARVLDGELAPVRADGARPPGRARPTPRPPRRVRRTARSRRSSEGTTSSRPGRPRAAAGASGSTSMPEQLADRALALGVGALAVVVVGEHARRRPTGSARASRRSHSRARARSPCRAAPGARSPAAPPRRAPRPRPRSPETRAQWTDTTTSPRSRVARVPRLQIRQRPQRVRPAEVPELEQHRPAPAAPPSRAARS